MKVKWIRGNIDPRCDEIVLPPTLWLCQYWDIPMGEQIDSPDLCLHYRFLKHPKPKRAPFSGVLVDDLPEAYQPDSSSFIKNLRTYDFLVAPNQRLLDNLQKRVGPKPAILYQGISGQLYYQQLGVLQTRRYADDNRMVFTCHGSYQFNVDDFAHEDWTLLYYSQQPIHTKPNILWRPFCPIKQFYQEISEFSPDVLVQGWVDKPYFNYKANLKFRESVMLNTCLVAQDIGNLYGINNGLNGFRWDDLDEFHVLLDTVSIDSFRRIGASHRENDREILTAFYQQLVQLNG